MSRSVRWLASYADDGVVTLCVSFVDSRGRGVSYVFLRAVPLTDWFGYC